MTFVSRTPSKAIDFVLTDKEIQAQPDWNQGQAPPLGTLELLSIAARELPKYTHGTGVWQLGSVNLERLPGLEGRASSNKWIYTVSYSQPDHRGNIQIPITFAGRAIQGVERPLDKRDQEY